jgi:cold shock protein
MAPGGRSTARSRSHISAVLPNAIRDLPEGDLNIVRLFVIYPHIGQIWHSRDERNKLMKQGTVKWFDSDRGFGFIAPDGDAQDVFVHHSEIQGSGVRSLTENQRVQFDIARGPKGPQAVGVNLL